MPMAGSPTIFGEGFCNLNAREEVLLLRAEPAGIHLVLNAHRRELDHATNFATLSASIFFPKRASYWISRRIGGVMFSRLQLNTIATKISGSRSGRNVTRSSHPAEAGSATTDSHNP